MANDDFPRVRGARTKPSRIALELGQVELDYPWELPASMDSGTTTSLTSVQNGESFDPPILTVRLYPGMRFHDRLSGEWLTVESFRWHNHDSDDMPDSAWYVEFAEDAPEGAQPTDLRWDANLERFARLLLKEKVVLLSGVEDYAEHGVSWAERVLS